MSAYKQIIVLYRTLLSFLFKKFEKIISKIKKTEAKYYFDSRQKLITVVLLVVVSGIFLFTIPATAAIQDLVITFMSWICYLLIMVFGWALTVLISLLIAVAQYNGFMTAQPVEIGWVLVRNICNMAFVIILLVIAFGTVLGVQSYNYKSLLKKLIIMALLINFSKTITAFIIDFSQIVMLTFVDAFKDAGYNFTKILGLDELLRFSFNQNTNPNISEQDEISDWGVLAALVLGLILVIVSSMVVLIFLIILIVRIVYLWMLMVLSPVAYFLSSFPGGQKYASKWWDTFTQQLIIGPLLAFFLWLALATAQSGAGKINLEGVAYDPNESYYGETGSGINTGVKTPSQATQPANLLSFMIAIVMLVVGLMLAQEVGGTGGAIAGKGLAKMRAVGTGQMGPTPMRWLRERGAAFRSKQEGARKTRAAEFGEGAFNRLEAAKGAVKTRRKAVTGMAMERIKGEPGKAQRNIAGAYENLQGAAVGGTHTIGDYEYKKNADESISARNIVNNKSAGNWEKPVAESQFKKAGKKKANQNIMSAISTLDANEGNDEFRKTEIEGQEFERLADGSMRVTEGGKEITTPAQIARSDKNEYDATKALDAKEAAARKTEIDGQEFERLADGSIKVTKGGTEITTKGKLKVEYMQRTRQNLGPAQMIMDESAKKKVDQRKGAFETLSPAELSRILTDTASSKNDKMAASMVMLAKDAFKDGTAGNAEFQLAKQHVSKSPSMAREWDETADKRNGLRNNTDADLERKISNGTIDPNKLNTNQLTNENIITLERITGVKFKDTIKKMSNTVQDQKNIAKALKNSFKGEVGEKGDKDGDRSRRIAYASISGDLKGAATESKTGEADHNLIQEMIRSAKPAQLAMVSSENIGDTELADDFINGLNRAQLKGLQRAGETTQLNKFLELIKSRVAAGDTKAGDLETNLSKDEELDSIYKQI